MTGNTERHYDLLGKTVMDDTVNQQERIADLNWLSGILEGEGCFSLCKRNDGKAFSPKIQITNTNILIIDKVQRIIKSLGLASYFRAFQSGGLKPCYRIEIYGIKRVKRFLDIVYPYVECRRDQLECVLEFVERRLSKTSHSPLDRDEMKAVERLAALNNPRLSPTSIRRRREELLSAKMCAGLHGDMQRTAEMTVPLRKQA